MKKSKFLLLLSALAITSCFQPFPSVPLPGLLQTQTLRGKDSVAHQVKRENLEEYVAILAGHQTTPDRPKIPERGSREGRALTRAYITQRLQSWGYQVEQHEYRAHGINVIAHLKASAPSDEYILVGAHLDSVSNAGADDNSSGSAAVLEIARILRDVPQRKVNLIFAWFDEEELGLIGSKYLARRYKDEKLKLTSVHTLDMVGYDGDGDSAIEIEQPDGELWAYYQKVNQTHNLNFKLFRTSSGSTDHVAFRREGFKSVGVCEEWANDDTTPYYHRRSDQFPTLNFQYLTHVTQLTVATISDLSQGVPAPLIYEIVPHHHFPGRDRPHHAEYPPTALP